MFTLQHFDAEKGSEDCSAEDDATEKGDGAPELFEKTRNEDD